MIMIHERVMHHDTESFTNTEKGRRLVKQKTGLPTTEYAGLEDEAKLCHKESTKYVRKNRGRIVMSCIFLKDGSKLPIEVLFVCDRELRIFMCIRRRQKNPTAPNTPKPARSSPDIGLARGGS
jgi:hypothetical protein